MLQPRAPKPINLKTLKIIWGALTFSILTYLFVLFYLEKITGIWLPDGDVLVIQKLALASNLILSVTFYFHSAKIAKTKSFIDKYPLYIMVWGLHETVVIIAFAGTFHSESGNGYFMLVNSTLAILANILTYPKQK